jgi:hypothetical protein
MANVITTPNMNLPNPVPGVDPGIDYANNIQSCFNQIDQHNHTSGQGVQVPSGGLNINADLPFIGNNATLLRSARFSAQVSPLALASDIGCVYVSGVDLYYNDVNGNQVRLTSGGSVNATASGISDGSGNSAAFSAGVLVVGNTSTAPDNIQCGSVLFGNSGTPSSGYVTVSPVSATSSYALTLPTIPGANSFMQLSTSGVMTASIPIANGITRSNLAAVGQQTSFSCGVFSTSSNTPVQITNLSVTITTSGRPVVIVMTSDTSGNPSSIGISNTTSSAESVLFINRGATVISPIDIKTSYSSVTSSAILKIPPGSTYSFDPVSAGTYTYTATVEVISGSFQALNCVLVAYEL